jgi:putative nucleotidyltransferase with HDIG domain
MNVLEIAGRRPSAWLGLGLAAGALMGYGLARRQPSEADDADQLHRALVDLLLNALSAGDPDTAEHSRRVADLSSMLAERLPLGRAQCATLRLAALLHDMGKIDDRFFDIVHSREPLSVEQRRTIESHPHQSAHILEPLEPLHPGITEIVGSHHECWNGSGYPLGLSGEHIPLAARVIAVADVFDALTQWRSYRDPMPVDDAFRQIRRETGSKFDPGVAALLDDAGLRARWAELVERGQRQCLTRQLSG